MVSSVDCLQAKNNRMVDDLRSCGDVGKVRNTAGACDWEAGVCEINILF